MVFAAVTHYRQQYIALFEQKNQLIRHTTTREYQSNGLTSVFLVAGSDGGSAVTRGSNGDIPYGQTSNSQKTATLVEKHAPHEITGFNIFASQGDQNAIMRDASMAKINRDIDQTIVDILDTSTLTTGATGVTASLNLITLAQGILGQNDVDVEDMDNMFAVITPAFRKYLLETTEFTNGDYVEIRPLNGPARKFYRWNGINFIVSTRLTGMGTATEKCYLYHRSAIGYACNVGEDKIAIGYDDKQDKSWSRATVYHGGVLLQNNGIVMMKHDGSAVVAV